MISRRALLGQAGWLVFFGGAAWLIRDQVIWRAPEVAFAAGAKSSGWLPFGARRHRLPTIDATLNGRPAKVLIDSGAQRSAIDRAFAEALGLASGFSVPMVAVGVSGAPQIGRVAGLKVEAGDLSLDGVKAAMLDLGPIADAAGLNVQAVLGQDVLGPLVLDIDFPRRRLMLADPADHVLPEGAVLLPARPHRGAMLAQVAVGSAGVEAVVDTGASMILALARDVAEEAGVLAGRQVRQGATMVLGGVLQGGAIADVTVRLGERTYEDVEVQIYEPQKLPGFPRALLGVEAFEDRRLILDHGRGRMHVAPSSRQS